MKKILICIAAILTTSCSSQYTEFNPQIDSAKLRLVSIPSNNVPVTEANNQCISKDYLPKIASLGFKANMVRSLSRIGMPAYNTDISDSQQN